MGMWYGYTKQISYLHGICRISILLSCTGDWHRARCRVTVPWPMRMAAMGGRAVRMRRSSGSDWKQHFLPGADHSSCRADSSLQQTIGCSTVSSIGCSITACLVRRCSDALGSLGRMHLLGQIVSVLCRWTVWRPRTG